MIYIWIYSWKQSWWDSRRDLVVFARGVLRYLAGTIDLGICYSGFNTDLIAHSDADWAGSLDRKSIGGYLMELCGGSISWACKRQRIVSLSSTESEYVAAAEAYSWRRLESLNLALPSCHRTIKLRSHGFKGCARNRE